MSTSQRGSSLYKALQVIIEDEYRRAGPSLRNTPCNTCDYIASLLQSRGICNSVRDCKLLCSDLVGKGFLVDYDGCLRSFPVDYAFKLTDLRKDSNSYYRIGYYDSLLCKLPRPDFTKVHRNIVEGILSSVGLETWPSLWHESYSEEQRDIIEYITKLLHVDKAGLVTIALDTGAGKTEAFLIPSLAYASAKKGRGRGKGRRAKVLIVYPRKALESDQVKRIAELYTRLALEGKVKCVKRADGVLDCTSAFPIVAIRDGESKQLKEVSRRKKERPRLQGLEVKEAIIGQDKWACKSEDVSYDRGTGFYHIVLKCRNSKSQYKSFGIVLPITDVRDILECLEAGSRSKVCGADIVVTNYDMVNRMLSGASKPLLYNLAEERGKLVLIADEAHLYHGISLKGFLALLARLATQFRNRLLVVISSATLPNVNQYVNLVKTIIGSAAGGVVSKGPVQIRGGGLTRKILVSIVQAEPKTAAAWLYQLASLQTIIQLIALNKNTPFNRKALGFFDSISFLSSTIRNLGQTLYNTDDLPAILKDHCKANPSVAMDWSPYIGMLTTTPASCKGNIDWGILAQQLLNNYPLGDVVAEHHAGLSRDEKFRIETMFKEQDKPLMVLATSTLEVGIDIPDIAIIGLYRLPPTPQSLMQRIGRAGRSDKTAYTANAFIILSNYPRDTLFAYDDNRRRLYLYQCYPNTPQPPLRLPVNITLVKQHYFLAVFDELAKDPLSKHVVEGIVSRKIQLKSHAKQLADTLDVLEKTVKGKRQQIEDTLKSIGQALYQAYQSIQGAHSTGQLHPRLEELLKNPATFLDELLETLREVRREQEGKIDEIIGLESRIEAALPELNNIANQAIVTLQRVKVHILGIAGSLTEEQSTGLNEALKRAYQSLAGLNSKASDLLRRLVQVDKHNLLGLERVLDDARYIINDVIDGITDVEDNISKILEILEESGLAANQVRTDLGTLLSMMSDARDKALEVQRVIDNVLDLVKMSAQVVYETFPEEEVTVLELLARIHDIPWASLWLDKGSRNVTYAVGESERKKGRDIDPLSALVKLTPMTIREG